MKKYYVIDLCGQCPRLEDCPGSWSEGRFCECEPGGYVLIELPQDSDHYDFSTPDDDDLPLEDRLDDRFCVDDDEPFDVITLGDLSAD